MPVNKDVNASDKPAGLATRTVSETDDSALVLPERNFTNAAAAIGAISQELIKARGYVTATEIQLMLTVRLMLCTVALQRTILQEAILLMTDRSTCN